MRTVRPHARERAFETETVIQWDDGHEEAVVYTLHTTVQNALLKRGARPVLMTRRGNRIASMTFHVPRAWIRIRPPHRLSAEERERLRQARLVDGRRPGKRAFAGQSPRETLAAEKAPQTV